MAFNQRLTLNNSMFTLKLRDFRLVSVRNKVVSSAKSQVSKLEALCKLLM